MDIDIDTTVSLNNGASIPLFGLGTFRSPAGPPTREAVRVALDAGYRHFDTAALYGNEKAVGDAIRASDIPRDEVFVTTKLHKDDHGYDEALHAFETSLERSGFDYVDLYLIHWPGSDRRLESWDALERIYDERRAHSVGVSNYMIGHLQEVLNHGEVVPAVNQFELHPFNYRSRLDVVELCRENDIVVEGYSPLVKGRRLDHPEVGRLAEAHSKTPAQVLIRWALQHCVVTIPKSTDENRIRENAAVFDFELSERDMSDLDALDEGYTAAWDPREVA